MRNTGSKKTFADTKKELIAKIEKIGKDILVIENNCKNDLFQLETKYKEVKFYLVCLKKLE